MKTIQHYFLLLAVALIMAACDYSNFPSGPSEYVYDTIDCSGWNIPEGSITVREALQIGKRLGSGGISSDYYYVKGIVTGFNNSLDKSGNPLHDYGMTTYGNAYFYIQDNLDVNASFYCYRTYGLNNTPFESYDQLQIGDFVVVKCKINNYNGLIETYWTSSDPSYLIYSSNDLNYPLKEVVYFTEEFTTGLGAWTELAVVDPGCAIWTHNITSGNKTSAMVDSCHWSCESWLVSPSINLGQTHNQPVKCAFQTYYRGNKNGYNAKDYLRFKVRKDGGTWTDMEIPVFNNGNLASYKNDTIDISAYVSSNTQVAFAYKSDDTFAPRWSIKSISVIENKRSRE